MRVANQFLCQMAERGNVFLLIIDVKDRKSAI